MSLKIDPNASDVIQITNSAGAVKFTSSNKLVFPKYLQTGTITINSSNSTVLVPFNFSLASNDFIHFTIKFNSCNGNIGQGLTGKTIPANGSILLDCYARKVENQGAADAEYLASALVNGQLMFRTVRVDYTKNVIGSTTASELVYTARVYSYI